MQTSRVNGLTSGVFAFLVPASCLNQKGSDTRRDNTTFPVADYYPIYLFLLQKRREQGKLAFSRFRGWTTEQREGVSYDVPVTADEQPLLYSAILRSSAAVFWHRGF